MRNIIIFLAFTFLFSCSLTKEPVYKSIGDIEIESFSMKEVVLKSDLIFYNPNSIGVDVESDNLIVLHKGAKIANVIVSKTKVKSKDTFTVPITIKIPTREFLKNNSMNLLGSILNSKQKKGETIDINIKGDIILRKKGIKYTHSLDEVQKIDINDYL